MGDLPSQPCGVSASQRTAGQQPAPSAVRERPILFSASMVRAILDGRKTQTRRIVKPQPSDYVPGANRHPTTRTAPYFDAYCGKTRTAANPRGMSQHWCWWSPDNRQGPDWIKCPYGVPGDVLWVREAWAVKRHEPCFDHEREYQELARPVIRYLADGAEVRHEGDRATGRGIYRGLVEKGRPSIHMPRWASRITLRITDVRVERLNDCSEADALAEGVLLEFYDSARDAYADLWEHINGPGSWDANPWVWVVTFERAALAKAEGRS